MDVISVTDRPALLTLCARVESAQRVALDTEFHGENSYIPRLMLLQLAFDDGVALVDPLAVPDLTPLARALEGRQIIGHALSADLRIFLERFDSLPPHVFDTQIAAAFCGFGASISLADAVRELVHVRLKKAHTVSDWSTRPLSPAQTEYLVDDVVHLIPLYERIRAMLIERGRLEWAAAECADMSNPSRYRVEGERLYLKVSGGQRLGRRELAILSELAQLRERIARERDTPLRFVASDDVLVAIASLRPKSVRDLDNLRRISEQTKRTLGTRLIEAVAAGEAWPEDRLPPKHSRGLDGGREALVTLMSVVAGAIAAREDLPPSLLTPRSSLERVVRELPRDFAAFTATLGLSDWRVGLVGEPLWRLLSGERKVTVSNYLDGDPHLAIDP
ncbi:ribonuclease D [bacterium]|nr:MAG: ribonuclease D [bacterium]